MTFAPTWNLRYTFPKLRVQHLRISQTATSPDLWSIGEMRIFNGQDQVTRTPSWRFDATPFPWDIGLAFDGNPVTRWKSWESIRPGMHVDVDFGAPVEMDRVELRSSHDQWKIEVHPEACDDTGCAVIPAKLEKLEDGPIGDLREARDANRESARHRLPFHQRRLPDRGGYDEGIPRDGGWSLSPNARTSGFTEFNERIFSGSGWRPIEHHGGDRRSPRQDCRMGGRGSVQPRDRP